MTETPLRFRGPAVPVGVPKDPVPDNSLAGSDGGGTGSSNLVTSLDTPPWDEQKNIENIADADNRDTNTNNTHIISAIKI